MIRAATALLLMIALAACSSDPDNTLDLGTTTSTDPTTTADPPTTTTSPEITTTTTTTIVDTTTTATTIPPATTPPVIETTAPVDVEAKVRADFDRAIAVRLACGQDPAACDFEAFAIPGSPVDTYTKELMATRVAQNQRTIEGNGSYEYVVIDLAVDASIAMVDVCIFDSVVVFDIGDATNPDDDAVVNDAQDSTTSRIELRQLDDRWLWFDNETLSSTPGVNSCAG